MPGKKVGPATAPNMTEAPCRSRYDQLWHRFGLTSDCYWHELSAMWPGHSPNCSRWGIPRSPALAVTRAIRLRFAVSPSWCRPRLSAACPARHRSLRGAPGSVRAGAHCRVSSGSLVVGSRHRIPTSIPGDAGTSVGPHRHCDSAESLRASLRFAGKVRCCNSQKSRLSLHLRQFSLHLQKLLIPRHSRPRKRVRSSLGIS